MSYTEGASTKKKKRKTVHAATLPAPVSTASVSFMRYRYFEEEEEDDDSSSPIQTPPAVVPDSEPLPRRKRGGSVSSVKRKKKSKGSPSPRKQRSNSLYLSDSSDSVSSEYKLPRKLTPRETPDDRPLSKSSSQLQVQTFTSEPIETGSPREKEKVSSGSKISKWFGNKKNSGKSKKKATTVFGACIADLVYDPQNTSEIPIIIRQCVDYLMTQDGL